MGYTTEFEGRFDITNGPLTLEHYNRLKDIAEGEDSDSCDPIRPDSWCQWMPSKDGMSIAWDGGEKFYNYVEWLRYLIDVYLKPWGYQVNGEVTWSGEESDDLGKIVVKDNVVTVLKAEIVYKTEVSYKEA